MPRPRASMRSARCWPPRQPQQRHRHAADAVAAARRAPRRGDRDGHEPSRRDRLSGRLGAADRGAGEQRAARPPRRGRHGARRGAREGRHIRWAATQGVAVINADDAFADYWRGLNATRRVVSFGLEQPADVRAEYALQAWAAGFGCTRRRVAPTSNSRSRGCTTLRNALAAAAAASAAGVPPASIARGLSEFTGVKGRLQVRSAAAGATLLDDTYNANPDSVFAALDVLAAMPARKIFVFGDMGETGDQARPVSRRSRRLCQEPWRRPALRAGCPERARGAQLRRRRSPFRPHRRSGRRAAAELRADTVVLVKGSRFMRMERVVDAIAMDGAPRISRSLS